MAVKVIIGTIAILTLAGCAANNTSQVPLAETYEYTTQQKMQAAHHWDVLASDVASRLQEHFKNASFYNRAIYVVPSNGSPFQTGFEDLLITQMVNQGLDIRANNSERLKLKFDTQVVSHSDRGYIRSKSGSNTTLALIATGVWAAVNIADNSTAIKDSLIAAGVIGRGVAMDATAGNITSISNKEVIINVSLMDGDKYLMRKTGIYYINESVNSNYNAPLAIKSIPVVGG
jgi:uncharacterized lipoprotein YajG